MKENTDNGAEAAGASNGNNSRADSDEHEYGDLPEFHPIGSISDAERLEHLGLPIDPNDLPMVERGEEDDSPITTFGKADKNSEAWLLLSVKSPVGSLLRGERAVVEREGDDPELLIESDMTGAIDGVTRLIGLHLPEHVCTGAPEHTVVGFEEVYNSTIGERIVVTKEQWETLICRWIRRAQPASPGISTRAKTSDGERSRGGVMA